MLDLNSLRFHRMFMIAAASILGSASVHASGVNGTIVAAFSNPVLAGTVANNPAAGQNTFEDNTGTAVYAISNSTAGSSLSWGSYPGSEPFQEFSELSFVGSAIPSDITDPFQLGTIAFTNGTSVDGTTIFDATLSFYYNTIGSSTFLGSDQVIITTTINVFGVPGGLTDGDDDYINICGNNSSICATSIEAVESSEGGTGVTVNLFGTIAGDPTLNITSVALASGQTATTNGFLGTDPPVGGETPEPATWATLSGALALGLVVLRRRSLTSR